MFWIFILLLIAFLAYQGDEARYHSKKDTKLIRWILILVLGFISGIGSPSGQDHQWYAELYRAMLNSKEFDYDILEHYEIGYVLLSRFCSILKIPEATFFLLIGIFINWSIVKFIYNFKYPAINICLFFVGGALLQQGNLVRQEIAAAIILFAILNLHKKNLKRFLVYVIIAGLFHTSAFLFLIFSPLCIVSIKREMLWKVTISGLLFLSILMALKFISLPFMDVLEKASSYEVYMNTDEKIGMQLSVFRVAFYNLIAVLFIFTTKKEYYQLSAVITLCAIILNLSVLVPNLARMYPYFSVIGSSLSLHSLSGEVLRINIKSYSTLIKDVVCLYIAIIMINDYVLADTVLLCSKTYSLSDFI